jgi:hypothetical protein
MNLCLPQGSNCFFTTSSLRTSLSGAKPVNRNALQAKRFVRKRVQPAPSAGQRQRFPSSLHRDVLCSAAPVFSGNSRQSPWQPRLELVTCVAHTSPRGKEERERPQGTLGTQPKMFRAAHRLSARRPACRPEVWCVIRALPEQPWTALYAWSWTTFCACCSPTRSARCSPRSLAYYPRA